MEINNNYYFLPEEISINILSRLPTVSVIRCSLVRKSWRNLIINNRDFAREFPRMHLLRGLESHHGAYCNGRANFLLLAYSIKMERPYTLYYTLDDDNYETTIPVLRSNPNPYNSKNYYVVGSCNGLICMAYANSSDYGGFEQPVYICNPVTRELLTLPSLTINECFCSCSTTNNRVRHFRKVVCGFGYLPSTDEYKVVRITYCSHGKYTDGRVRVYTLGDGIGWRDKGQITYGLTYYNNPPSILANGALHWLEDEEGKIVAFDLANEEFLLLPSPPCFDDDDNECLFQIQVLGGQLCVFRCKGNLTKGMWGFKNKNKEKHGNYKDVNGQQQYQFWSWVKEFDIELMDLESRHHPTPFILTKHGDVLYYTLKGLFCYKFKTATSEKLLNIEQYMSKFHRFEAIIPHLNSFISLKAIEEEDTKIIIESPS